MTTLDDFVRYLPNVSVASNGPGQGEIFMRGLSVGAAGSQSSGTIGGFPNVAIFLDDQSGQLPSRNLDVNTLVKLTPAITTDSATGQLAFHSERSSSALTTDGVLTTNTFAVAA